MVKGGQDSGKLKGDTVHERGSRGGGDGRKVEDLFRKRKDISAAESEQGGWFQNVTLLHLGHIPFPPPSHPRKLRKELESWFQSSAGVCFHSRLLGHTIPGPVWFGFLPLGPGQGALVQW